MNFPCCMQKLLMTNGIKTSPPRIVPSYVILHKLFLSSCPLCFWRVAMIFLHKLHEVLPAIIILKWPNPLEKWLYCNKVHNGIVIKALIHLCIQEALESYCLKLKVKKKNKQNTSLGLSYFLHWTMFCLYNGARLAGAVCLSSVMWQGIPVL